MSTPGFESGICRVQDECLHQDPEIWAVAMNVVRKKVSIKEIRVPVSLLFCSIALLLDSPPSSPLPLPIFLFTFLSFSLPSVSSFFFNYSGGKKIHTSVTGINCLKTILSRMNGKYSLMWVVLGRGRGMTKNLVCRYNNKYVCTKSVSVAGEYEISLLLSTPDVSESIQGRDTNEKVLWQVLYLDVSNHQWRLYQNKKIFIK